MSNELDTTFLLGTPLVSVVVPCFGEGRYLDDCLWSIRRQHHRHVEIIVVDDAGEDDSIAIALDHANQDERVRVFRIANNVGLGAVRNRALDFARGELVTFVDGDDLLPPHSIAARVASLAAHLVAVAPEDRHRIIGSYGDWRYATAAIEQAPTDAAPRALLPIDLAASAGGNVFIVSAPLVRTEVLRTCGGFAEDVSGGEDYVAWMRVLSGGGVFVPCPEVVAVYRQKPASMVRSSTGEFATLAAAGRAWIGGAIARLPPRPCLWPELDDLGAGEHTIEFGAVVDRTPTASAAPVAPAPAIPWTTTAPKGPLPPSPTAARIASGAALLARAPLGDRARPDVDVFEPPAGPYTAGRLRISRHGSKSTGAAIGFDHADPRLIVQAGSWFGGMVAAAIAALMHQPGDVRLELTSDARNGALRLLSPAGLPAKLQLGPLLDWSIGPTMARILVGSVGTVGALQLDVGLDSTPDMPGGLTLVAAALDGARLSDGPAMAAPSALSVIGPDDADVVTWLEGAVGILAATDSRTARRCCTAGLTVNVVTARLVAGSTTVHTNDPDISLLAQALERPVTSIGEVISHSAPAIPILTGSIRSEAVAALITLLGGG